MRLLLLVVLAFSPMIAFAATYDSEMPNTRDSDALISELTQRLLYKQKLADALLDKVNSLQTNNAELRAELQQKIEEIAQLRAEIQRGLEARNNLVYAKPSTTREQPRIQAPAAPAQPQGRWVEFTRRNLVRPGYWNRVNLPDTYVPVYDYYHRRIGTQVCHHWRNDYIQPVYETIYYRQWQQY